MFGFGLLPVDRCPGLEGDVGGFDDAAADGENTRQSQETEQSRRSRLVLHQRDDSQEQPGDTDAAGDTGHGAVIGQATTDLLVAGGVNLVADLLEVAGEFGFVGQPRSLGPAVNGFKGSAGQRVHHETDEEGSGQEEGRNDDSFIAKRFGDLSAADSEDKEGTEEAGEADDQQFNQDLNGFVQDVRVLALDGVGGEQIRWG